MSRDSSNRCAVNTLVDTLASTPFARRPWLCFVGRIPESSFFFVHFFRRKYYPRRLSVRYVNLVTYALKRKSSYSCCVRVETHLLARVLSPSLCILLGFVLQRRSGVTYNAALVFGTILLSRRSLPLSSSHPLTFETSKHISGLFAGWVISRGSDRIGSG